MTRKQKEIRTDIGCNDAASITPFGRDFPSEILGRLNLVGAHRAAGKMLPMNATGAIGALCCETGFVWNICRGLGVMERAGGLVGPIPDESRRPMAAEILHRIEDDATAHMRRPT